MENNKKRMFRVTRSINATTVKYNNAKIIVGKRKDDLDYFTLQFKIFTKDGDADEPRSWHFNLRDKVAVTELNCSEDGLLALYHALHSELERKFGVENNKK